MSCWARRMWRKAGAQQDLSKRSMRREGSGYRYGPCCRRLSIWCGGWHTREPFLS